MRARLRSIRHSNGLGRSSPSRTGERLEPSAPVAVQSAAWRRIHPITTSFIRCRRRPSSWGGGRSSTSCWPRGTPASRAWSRWWGWAARQDGDRRAARRRAVPAGEPVSARGPLRLELLPGARRRLLPERGVPVLRRASRPSRRPAKGAGLLHLLREALAVGGPHLLVLDGLERVQRQEGDGPGAFGQVEDPLLRGLLTRLAEGVGKATALVTSRFPLTDLEPMRGRGYRHRDVEGLDRSAALDLLRRHGVRGDDDDARRAGGIVRGARPDARPPGRADRPVPRRRPVAGTRGARAGVAPAGPPGAAARPAARRLPGAPAAGRAGAARPPLPAAAEHPARAGRPAVPLHARRSSSGRPATSRPSSGGSPSPTACPGSSRRRWPHRSATPSIEAHPGGADRRAGGRVRRGRLPGRGRVAGAVRDDHRGRRRGDRPALRRRAGATRRNRGRSPGPIRSGSATRSICTTNTATIRSTATRSRRRRWTQAFLHAGWAKPSDGGVRRPDPGGRGAWRSAGRSGWCSSSPSSTGCCGWWASIAGSISGSGSRAARWRRSTRRRWAGRSPALVDRHLVLREADGTLSVHPAVRDYFAGLTTAADRGLWHHLIGDQLISLVQRPGLRLPEDQAALDLAEEAIAHALESGRPEKAWTPVRQRARRTSPPGVEAGRDGARAEDPPRLRPLPGPLGAGLVSPRDGRAGGGVRARTPCPTSAPTSGCSRAGCRRSRRRAIPGGRRSPRS